MFHCVNSSNFEALDLVISHGFDVNKRDPNCTVGDTLNFRAINVRSEAIVRRLLQENSLDLNLKGYFDLNIYEYIDNLYAYERDVKLLVLKAVIKESQDPRPRIPFFTASLKLQSSKRNARPIG